MHVAINGWFWQRPETGSGQYLRQLVAALPCVAPSLAPPETLALTLLLPEPPTEDLPPTLTALHLPPRGTGGLSKTLWEQFTVPQAARRLRVDVLHVPYWASPGWMPVPTVVTIHDLIPLLLPAYRTRRSVRFYTALVRATAARAAAILTDSEAAREDILRHLRVPSARVHAVPLAAEEVYCPTPAADDAAHLAALGVTPGYLLYLGGFDARKNLATLCAALARVLERAPTARLVIAGKLPAEDSAFAPDPRRLARESHLPEMTVQCIGYVPEAAKPALYRGARAFVFPSRYEGFGLPPLEALACGIPVAGSNAASLPEVVGDAGILVAPDDVAGLAEGLLRLLTEGDFHAEMAQRAVQQAARFSWEQTARRTLEVYRQAAQKWIR